MNTDDLLNEFKTKVEKGQKQKLSKKEITELNAIEKLLLVKLGLT